MTLWTWRINLLTHLVQCLILSPLEVPPWWCLKLWVYAYLSCAPTSLAHAQHLFVCVCVSVSNYFTCSYSFKGLELIINNWLCIVLTSAMNNIKPLVIIPSCIQLTLPRPCDRENYDRQLPGIPGCVPVPTVSYDFSHDLNAVVFAQHWSCACRSL